MSQQSMAELFKKIAEPALRQCLFVGSLVLLNLFLALPSLDFLRRS